MLGAVWHPKGATVDPFMVCNAFAKRAKKNGVKFLHNYEVKKIERNFLGFKVFCTKNVEEENNLNNNNSNKIEEEIVIEADKIVVTVGWLGGKFTSMLGHDIPVRGIHG